MSLSDCQRVVHSGKLYDVTRKVHLRTGHGGRDKVLAAVKREYYGVTRGYVEQFCTSCPTCQKAAPNTVKAPLKPIVETEFLNRIQVDLIDMRQSPDRGYNHICHVMDHYTKFHIIYPLKTKTAQEVAFSLEERVLAYMGTPRIFHSDNGREFVNQVLRALFEKWGGDTIFVNGRPRHSQSQGLVERGNRTIEEKLAKMKEEHDPSSHPSGAIFPWASFLPRIMYVLNTQVSETTKQVPYELVYGQEARGNFFPGARTGLLNEEDVQTIINNSSAASAPVVVTPSASAGTAPVVAVTAPVVAATALVAVTPSASAGTAQVVAGTDPVVAVTAPVVT